MSKLTDRENRRKKSIVGSIIEAPAASTVIDGAGRPKTGRETKKTYTLMFYPSVYENAKLLASLERRSVSDVIGSLLSQYVQENRDKISLNNDYSKR